MVGKIIWCSTKNAVAGMFVKCVMEVQQVEVQPRENGRVLTPHEMEMSGSQTTAPHRKVPRTIGEQKGLTANQSVLLLNDPKRRFGGGLPLWDMSCLMWHGISCSCHPSLLSYGL